MRYGKSVLDLKAFPFVFNLVISSKVLDTVKNYGGRFPINCEVFDVTQII